MGKTMIHRSIKTGVLEKWLLICKLGVPQGRFMAAALLSFGLKLH